MIFTTSSKHQVEEAYPSEKTTTAIFDASTVFKRESDFFSYIKIIVIHESDDGFLS